MQVMLTISPQKRISQRCQLGMKTQILGLTIQGFRVRNPNTLNTSVYIERENPYQSGGKPYQLIDAIDLVTAQDYPENSCTRTLFLLKCTHRSMDINRIIILVVIACLSLDIHMKPTWFRSIFSSLPDISILCTHTYRGSCVCRRTPFGQPTPSWITKAIFAL